MFQCALTRFAASETFVIRSLLGRQVHGAHYVRSVQVPMYQTPELRPSMAIVRLWVSATQSENGGFRAVNRLLPDLRPVRLSAGRLPLHRGLARPLARSSPAARPRCDCASSTLVYLAGICGLFQRPCVRTACSGAPCRVIPQVPSNA